MKRLYLPLVLIFLGLQAWPVSYKQLAHEMSFLLPKMKAHDPARLIMVLRLADVLFESTIEVDKNEVLSARELTEIERNQKKAVELYEYALTGLNGAVAVPAKDLQYRIEFQLGRLYTDLGQLDKAEQKWRLLVRQELIRTIQQEASLRLAEKLELSNQTSDLAYAGELYDLALLTCDKADLCSFAEFRRAWIFHRLNKSAQGVQFLLKSLKHADASIREQILKDLVLFLTHTEWKAERAIELLTQLDREYHMPWMIDLLASSYFTADQKVAYQYTVQYLINKDPRLEYYISLLEFKYSQNQLKELPNILSQLESAIDRHRDKPTDKQLEFSSLEKQNEAEKLLFRLIFQLDTERKNQPEIFQSLVSRCALAFTKIFQTSPQFKQVADGWLAVTDNTELKLAQLKIWREQQEKLNQSALIKHFYQIELSIVLQIKNWEQVITIATELLNRNPEAAELRALSYQKAKAQYELKQFDQALPIFQKLANVAQGNETNAVIEKPDQYAIYSQNLALDILGQQQKYTELQTQAGLWLNNVKLQKLATQENLLAKEIEDMSMITDKASFTTAVTKMDPAALATFKKLCFTNKLVPQSCDNAKILAVKLHDQQSTIEILRHQGRDEELIAELEFAGYFSEAAKAREQKINSASPPKELLLISVLYELNGELKERERILNQLTKQMAHLKSPLAETEEIVLFQALKESSLFNTSLLNLPWSSGIKIQLASELEQKGMQNSQTQNLLLKSCIDSGPSWHKTQLTRLRELNNKQKQLSIIGRHSQENFKKRVSLLNQLTESAQCYLKASTRPELRVGVMFAMSRSFLDFAKQITSVPLPEDLTPEVREQVKAQVAEMAKPFQEQGDSWFSHTNLALDKIPNLEREQVNTTFISNAWDFEANALPLTAAPVVNKNYSFDWEPLLKTLRTNPYDKVNLEQLKSHFEQHNQKRLSAYIEGQLKGRVE